MLAEACPVGDLGLEASFRDTFNCGQIFLRYTGLSKLKYIINARYALKDSYKVTRNGI